MTCRRATAAGGVGAGALHRSIRLGRLEPESRDPRGGLQRPSSRHLQHARQPLSVGVAKGEVHKTMHQRYLIFPTDTADADPRLLELARKKGEPAVERMGDLNGITTFQILCCCGSVHAQATANARLRNACDLSLIHI